MTTRSKRLFNWPVAVNTDDPQRARVLREQTGLLIRQSRTGLITAIVAALLMGVPMVKTTGLPLFTAWLVVLVVGLVLRQWLMERAQASGSLEGVLRVTMVGSALLGLIITAPNPIFLPHAGIEARAFLTMIHVAWMTAAVSVLGVFPPSYKVYLSCSMFNIMLGWWLSGDTSNAAVLTAALVPLWALLTRFSNRVGKLLEESVDIRHERELLVQRLREALVETEAAHVARSRFLASASHDLLQPVHALLLLSSLTRDMPEGPRRKDALRQLHATAESIDSMFRGLLDLARYEAGTLHPQLSAMPVAHVLRSIQAACESRCTEKGVRFIVDAPAQLHVLADPAMFDRIMRNLIDNAIKFTPHGEVTVRCTHEGECVLIEVRDTGVGISSDDLAHVKEAFFRGSAAREVEAEGVGLGLANSSQMATLLGGNIEISSKLGQGTRVLFTLPGAPAPQTAFAASRVARALRYHHIALVEDDRQAREVTVLWLQERGAQVIAGVDAATVLRGFESAGLTPDFILSDFKLGSGPDAPTGADAIQALRRRFGAALPAAIISGELLLAAALPADIVLLPKPLRPERLEELLSDS